MLGRARLVHEDHAGIEKALLAGDPREDGVRHDMRDPPGVGGFGRILLAGDLLPGPEIPQPEVGLEAVAAPLDPAGDQELGGGRLPGRDLRRIGIGIGLGEGFGIERLQIDATA